MKKKSKTHLLLLEKRKQYQDIILQSESDSERNSIRKSCSEYIINKYKLKIKALNNLIDELEKKIL